MEWQVASGLFRYGGGLVPEVIVKSSEILEGSISRPAEEHSSCEIKLVFFRESQAEKYVGGDSLLVVDEKERPLFQGIIQDQRGQYAFNEYTLYLHASSATGLMDTKARLHTYQNMTRKEIIEFIVALYGGEVIFTKPDQGIGQRVSPIQYKESDWDLIKRLAREGGCQVWAEHTDLKPRIYIDGKNAGIDRERSIVFREHKIVKESDFPEENLAAAGYTSILYQASRASYMDYPIPAGWEKLDETVNKLGYSVLVLRKEDNIIIAYRGTDDVVDMVYDASGTAMEIEKNSYMSYTMRHFCDVKNKLKKKAYSELYGQNYLAVQTLKQVLKKYPNAKIYLTGHSLGGHLAQEAMLEAKRMGVGDRIKRVELFNALGSFEMREVNELSNEYGAKIFHRKIKGDLVGAYLRKAGQEKTYSKLYKGTHSIHYFHNEYSYKPRTKFYRKDYHGVLESLDSQQAAKASVHCIGLLGTVLEANNQYIQVKFNVDRKAVTTQNAHKIKFFSCYFALNGESGAYMPPDKGASVLIHFPGLDLDSGIYRGTKQFPTVQRDKTGMAAPWTLGKDGK